MPNKFRANRMTLWKRERIYGDAKKTSQPESETSSILSSEEGRHLTWGIIDEEHKGSDFVKELLTT